MTGISPLAPDAFPELPSIDGLKIATFKAGVKYKDRTDLMIAIMDPGTTIAGVFTRSSTRSAAVLDCQAKLGSEPSGPAAIVVNSGNANAFTGSKGEASVERICNQVHESFGVSTNRVFTSSTGVIGELLPEGKITSAIAKMAPGDSNLQNAAEAIRTTDTFAKGAFKVLSTDAGQINICGIAKGSGMIAPDMATMLVYIFTDAKIDQAYLQDTLSELNERTFNSITVDSDTSTSDTVICAATGASGIDVSGSTTFSDALHEVMQDLAHQVVRDGEGATKFIEVSVTNAETDADANLIARAIANSPLVKTAIAGEDPNWGRIIMAIGKSGAMADRDKLSIWFGNILVAEKGWVASTYSEGLGAAYMKNQDIQITVDLGLGSGTAKIWTCDLTHAYITINADYRS